MEASTDCWFQQPIPSMITNLQSYNYISTSDKTQILQQLSKSHHPILVQFNENALEWKDLKNSSKFKLYDNVLLPSWNDAKMVRSYIHETVGYFTGDQIRTKISSQFKKEVKQYDKMAKEAAA